MVGILNANDDDQNANANIGEGSEDSAGSGNVDQVQSADKSVEAASSQKSVPAKLPARFDDDDEDEHDDEDEDDKAKTVKYIEQLKSTSGRRDLGGRSAFTNKLKSDENAYSDDDDWHENNYDEERMGRSNGNPSYPLQIDLTVLLSSLVVKYFGVF